MLDYFFYIFFASDINEGGNILPLDLQPRLRLLVQSQQ